jgi:hypothetical protein
MQIFAAFILGFLASVIAALYYGYASRPCLKVMPDTQSFTGQTPNQPPHEFYHLIVRNIPPRWPIPTRRPAWSCKVSLELFDLNGKHVISDPIIGRWPSQPEPLLPAVFGTQIANLIDPARLITAQKIDIHQHEDQRFAVALKYEGDTYCHIFLNESYLYPKWEKPEWKLDEGEYKLSVIIYYERGREVSSFRLVNIGNKRDGIKIKLW